MKQTLGVCFAGALWVANILSASMLLASMLLASRAHADLSLETESARVLAPGKVELSAAAEYQTSNNNGDEFALPLAIEIGVLPRVEVLIEPTLLVSINPENGKKSNGVGDTELTVNYLAFDESARLPAVAFGLEWKVPTARKIEIGTKKSDFAFYIIASKRFGDLDVNANLTYTLIGEPKNVSVKNTWAVSVSGDYTLNATWDAFAEATYTSSAVSKSGGENACTGVCPVSVSGGSSGEAAAWQVPKWAAASVLAPSGRVHVSRRISMYSPASAMTTSMRRWCAWA